FDAASDRMGEHVHSSFDFRLQDETIPGQRPEDGLAYLLLPTDVYGEQGIDETLLGPDFSAEQPTALGGLGLGLQPFGNQDQQGAIVTLAWDGQPVARSQFLPQDPAFGNLSDWNQALIDVQRVDDGGLVNIALAGPDGQPMPLLDPVFIPGMSLDGAFRPAFTTHAMAGLALRDIDNLVLDYGLSLLGDFNHDGMFDVQDINRLAEAIAFGASDQNLDLTGDSAVDQQDLTAWVKDIQGTWFGDSDLSGEFDSTDLVRVFQAGKYESGETALWSEGDWNADGLFDTSDMILAFQDGGFERSMGASVRTAAVPETNSNVLAAIALLGLVLTRRRLG
ncbi:MAG: hypothetical protein KDA87_23985, partial [Planctomycetales bacterium]|nr:hypothetical protein [Planctomycetales bacterium]